MHDCFQLRRREVAQRFSSAKLLTAEMFLEDWIQCFILDVCLAMEALLDQSIKPLVGHDAVGDCQLMLHVFIECIL